MDQPIADHETSGRAHLAEALAYAERRAAEERAARAAAEDAEDDEEQASENAVREFMSSIRGLSSLQFLEIALEKGALVVAMVPVEGHLVQIQIQGEPGTPH